MAWSLHVLSRENKVGSRRAVVETAGPLKREAIPPSGTILAVQPHLCFPALSPLSATQHPAVTARDTAVCVSSQLSGHLSHEFFSNRDASYIAFVEDFRMMSECCT